MWFRLKRCCFRLNADQAKPVKDPDILSVDELQEGQIIRGYIKSVEKHGTFIWSDILPWYEYTSSGTLKRLFRSSRLSRSITGRADLQHTTKYFCSNHKVLCDHLPPSTLITTKILRYKNLLILKYR